MASRGTTTESGPTFSLLVVGRKGRLTLGKSLAPAAALGLLRAQRGDALGGQELVVMADRTGELIDERTLEQMAGVTAVETGAASDGAETLAASSEAQAPSAGSQGAPPAPSERSPDVTERGRRAMDLAQRARAEYQRVHEINFARLRARPVLRDEQVERLEWTFRAVEAQFSGALSGYRAVWETVAARRARLPR